MSCDLLPTEVEGPHHMGDGAEVLRRLEELAPLGSRMRPIDSLLDRVRSGAGFTTSRSGSRLA